jgi:hypothetical protein
VVPESIGENIAINFPGTQLTSKTGSYEFIKKVKIY